MRFREHQKQQTQERGEVVHAEKSPRDTRLVRRVLVVTLGLAMLSAAGFGVYSLVFAARDIKLTAGDAWKEFAQNTPESNKKYRGKFVRVTGKLKVYTVNKKTQLFFESPEADSKWFILFTVPAADAKSLQDGQDITVRGRFTNRKEPDGHLSMSNCSLVKEK